MAYVRQVRFRERAASIGLAAGVQVALGAALVGGLAMHGFAPVERPVHTFTVPATTAQRTPPVSHRHDQRRAAVPQITPTTAALSSGTDLLPVDHGLPTTVPPSDIPVTPPVHPATVAPRAAMPAGRPGDWVTASDYPGADLRAGHAGVTRFSLSVGTDGRVSSCVVTASSGWPGLDNATCRLILARGRFRAASDETGQAVMGSFAGAIRWVIPDGED